MLERIDQVVIAVADVAQATRRTARLLGRMPSWTSETPAAGARSTLFELGNAALALVEPCASGPISDLCRRRLDARGEGPCALIFESGSPDEDCARLAAAGLAPGAAEPLLEHDDPSGAWRRILLRALPVEATGGLPLLLASRDTQTEIRPPSSALTETGSCVDRLDHAVVLTEAPDRARRLYGEQLGLRLALDRSFEERGLRLLFFRLGGATLEIASRIPDDARDAAAPSSDPADPGAGTCDTLYGLAHRVADIDGAHARLARAGVETSPIRDGHKPGTRVFSVSGEEAHGVPTLFVGEAG